MKQATQHCGVLFSSVIRSQDGVPTVGTPARCKLIPTKSLSATIRTRSTMRISGLNYSNVLLQRDMLLEKAQQRQTNSSSAVTPTVSTSTSKTLTAVGTFSDDLVQDGFLGASLATIKAAAAQGYSYNSLAVLSPSDFDLIKNTTGVTIKGKGTYYDAEGNLLGLSRDSNGNLIGVKLDDKGNVIGSAPEAVAAFNLTNTLENMRDNAMYNDDLPYQNGKAITAEDLKAYVQMYQDLGVPLQGVDVIAKAEGILKLDTSSAA